MNIPTNKRPEPRFDASGNPLNEAQLIAWNMAHGGAEPKGGTELVTQEGKAEAKPVIVESNAAETALYGRKTLAMSELDTLVKIAKSEEFIVDGLVPKDSVVMACGESTIGKTPFHYQLLLSVASGAPFLGMPVKEKGRVLYIDLENSGMDSQQLRDRLSAYLGVSGRIPDDIFRVALHRVSEKTIGEYVHDATPLLTVIDSLRSFCPGASAKNEKAGEVLNTLKALARSHHTTFVVLHHPRKDRSDDSQPFTKRLDDTTVEEWMQQMEGARALFNQSDVRIAMEAGDGNPVALRFKWNRRVHGDSPLHFIERTLDEEGEALGYRKLEGRDFLRLEYQTAFDRLDGRFSFGDVVAAFGGRSKSKAQEFIAACLSLGLVKRIGERRGYVKV